MLWWDTVITGLGQAENEERHINIGMRNGKVMSFKQATLASTCSSGSIQQNRLWSGNQQLVVSAGNSLSLQVAEVTIYWIQHIKTCVVWYLKVLSVTLSSCYPPSGHQMPRHLPPPCQPPVLIIQYLNASISSSVTPGRSDTPTVDLALWFTPTYFPSGDICPWASSHSVYESDFAAPDCFPVLAHLGAWFLPP